MKNIINEKLNGSEFICKGGWKSGNTIILDDGAERNIDYKKIEDTEYVSIILTPKDIEKLNIELISYINYMECFNEDSENNKFR
ncbi:hypothetical protein IR152_15830 [Clostridioides sp. ES-S-0108-01]|uniref:hypothetical protein n=1 Tax=unclassified Clostridioides TaxID=2635829 RepID=UPI001C18D1E3|nr:hypothetical protein [Clostridioides sp. ES-S-0107-01]MCC0784506.1 hypothetical protein [Clostridioides sp. ES-S-0108-01]UDN53125.1 hypothetical protein JJC16_18990 [Clostridioides sp. ES-S-0107-01]HBG2405085.1 hypothetical protein [Clostridioides difficile]